MPEEWHRSVMVLLPKVPRPVKAKDTRSIAISSATERLFCRLVLQRCKQHLRHTQPSQCAGPHRQTADYLHSLYRLCESEREWSRGLAVVKVDLARAFDSVRRDKLLNRLHARLGATEEFRVWVHLFSDTSTIFSTTWGQTSFKTSVGIRQGAIESPMFFAFAMDCILAETSERFQWGTGVSSYADMTVAELAFMDDCLLWEGDTNKLQAKLKQVQVVLLEWGLQINASKCSLYTSPKHQGSRRMVVGDTVLESQEMLTVMGVRFSTSHNVREMLQGVWQRAKSKFWSIRHLLGKNAVSRSDETI